MDIAKKLMTEDDLLTTILKEVAAPAADADTHAWLDGQDQRLLWLLAHTYAGVIWGKREATGWTLSSDFPEQPALVAESLLEMRVFGPVGEVFVWRDGATFRARAIFDDDAGQLDVVDEVQMLWGSAGEPVGGTFTRVWDGSQGMEMIVPLRPEPDDFLISVKTEDGQPRIEEWRPLRMVVRNYVVAHPETGLAQIAAARLVDLKIDPGNKKQEIRDVAEAQ